MVNVLAADRLINNPKLYATFLLWLLSELFEELPEIGDPDRPKLVFFFDEAHLLFDDAPKVLVEKVEQVVRLIRSKGVGVYFVTQNPLDIPDEVLGQLGNRVQHALRAFTPRDQKAVRAAAETFRQNPPSTPKTRLPSSRSARRWSPPWMQRARPAWSNEPVSARRRRGSVPHRRRSATASWPPAPSPAATTGKSTANPPMNSYRRARKPPRQQQPAPPAKTGRQRQSPTEALVKSVLRVDRDYARPGDHPRRPGIDLQGRPSPVA